MGTTDAPALLAEPLIRLASDPDAHVRRGAAQALGWLGPEAQGATATLIALLDDADPEVQRAACSGLGVHGGALVAREPLVALLDTPDAELRLAAVLALCGQDSFLFLDLNL